MRILSAPAVLVATCFGQAYGTWKMNAARSTFSGGVSPKSFTVRIEPHPKGEVFTVDRTEPDGRTTSSSTILYLDGAAREFQDFECSGTQLSRRIDGETVEILRQCGAGAWTKFVRHSTDKSNKLMIDIMEKRRPGPNLDWRLILEKQ